MKSLPPWYDEFLLKDYCAILIFFPCDMKQFISKETLWMKSHHQRINLNTKKWKFRKTTVPAEVHWKIKHSSFYVFTQGQAALIWITSIVDTIGEQNEIVPKPLPVCSSGTDIIAHCGSFDQHILWISSVWKCNPSCCVCDSRCVFGVFSHHCLPVILFHLYLSSWVGGSACATVQDSNIGDCDLHR